MIFHFSLFTLHFAEGDILHSSFLILHIQRAAERSNFDFSLFTLHFAEGDISVLSV